MKLSELKKLIHDNNIRGISHLNKPELMAFLIEKGILSYDNCDKPQKIEKDVDEKYLRLKDIRNNPRQVEVTDTVTEDKAMFKSIYGCAKYFKISPSLLQHYDNKLFKDRYKIVIIG